MKTSLLALPLCLASFACAAKAILPGTERWVTTSGVRVVFYPAHEVPMLDINVALAAGSAWDNKHPGLSMLTASLIDKGSRGQDATQIAERLENTGAQFRAQTSRTMLALSLRTLTEPEALSEATGVFADMLAHPDFDNEAVLREKELQKMAIHEGNESPDNVASNTFFAKLYGTHPYAHAVTGTIESVNAIKRDDVRTFYKTYFTGRNTVMVLVGDIDSQKAHALADAITRDLPKGAPAPVISKASPLTTAENAAVPFPSSQTVLRLGEVSIDHHSPDYFPLTVGNYILGGGTLVSRLSLEVRDRRGLTYGVSSQFAPMPAGGPFLIGLSTKTASAAEALALTRDTLKDFVAKGPTDAELAAAKQFLQGSFPLSLSGNRNIAELLLKIAFYNLPEEYLDTYLARINAVNADAIRTAFQKHIKPGQMLTVSVGKMV
ncbi:insulinase family protein [Legionella geestiana]|uniref:M16 family metallopeptidase n=1 Tax=Legionella geestiana TaxID=45065 RepID=UPI001091F76E|nr:pitrilysin family protein [Legionella geestiana]QDQ39713.1 insulinase family protein [Legionella geestiana]